MSKIRKTTERKLFATISLQVFKKKLLLFFMRTHVYVKKHLKCATNMISVASLSESNFEALTLYYKSFAKSNYLLRQTADCYYHPDQLSQWNHDPKYKFCPAMWNGVPDGKMNKKVPVTSSQKITLFSNKDSVKCL